MVAAIFWARQSSVASERFADDIFNLAVQASQIIIRPALERMKRLRIDSEEERLWSFISHEPGGVLAVDRARIDDRLGVSV